MPRMNGKPPFVVNGRPVAKPNRKFPGVKMALPVDAEQLGHLARDLGDPDSQVHLGHAATLTRLIKVSFSPR